MYSKKHRVIYRNKIYWTKKKKKDTICFLEGRKTIYTSFIKKQVYKIM